LRYGKITKTFNTKKGQTIVWDGKSDSGIPSRDLPDWPSKTTPMTQ
jgi:hypothetical protein